MTTDVMRMAGRLMDMLTPTVRAHRWDDCATSLFRAPPCRKS